MDIDECPAILTRIFYLLMQLMLFYLPVYYANQAIPVLTLLASHPDETRLPISQLEELQTEWEAFLTRRRGEWITIAGVSFTFLMASPPALQMAHDPFTRSLIYFSMFRAVSAIVCSAMHLMTFCNSQSLTGRFADAWFQDVDKQQGSAVSKQAVILSLPAVAVCWGATTFLIALASALWHGVSSESIGVAPKSIITASCFADFFCLAWALATFQSVKRQVVQTLDGSPAPNDPASPQ